jgi:hypothetical protein
MAIVLEKVALTIALVEEETRDCFGATCHPMPHPEDESAAKTEVAEMRAISEIRTFFIWSSMNDEYLLTD